MKIRKGDTVTVIKGKDRGKQGAVERAYSVKKTVLVKGINVYKKHVKKSEQFPSGGIIEVNRPMSTGNIMLICPSCKKPTRVGYEVTANKKQRICRKCKKIIRTK